MSYFSARTGLDGKLYGTLHLGLMPLGLRSNHPEQRISPDTACNSFVFPNTARTSTGTIRGGAPSRLFILIIVWLDILCMLIRESTFLETTYSYMPGQVDGAAAQKDRRSLLGALISSTTTQIQQTSLPLTYRIDGTRASMIKYIETGEVDYEDLYVDALKAMCSQRGVKHKYNELRLDLARKLSETDEKEVAYRDLGATALRKLCKERGMKVKSNEPKQDLITRLRQADENAEQAQQEEEGRGSD
ncbi:hypothetical protein DSL72_001170 [Monilinia vaccinii-corymbosi]|uniref:Uncharacterized protein n=1 Tax=Monilinia vaccinii-corymbosi TaxID=61207 RepID=A0A8A3P1A6_9HELO|nr:hypothetical protein DSL72_001170 [Monilinia vaccinii-corymbosi]